MTSANVLWPVTEEEGRDPLLPLLHGFKPGAGPTPPLRFEEFIRGAWHIVEPQTRYTHGRHISVLAAHAERLTYYAKEALYAHGLIGRQEYEQWEEIEKLLVNIPPRYMKSLLFGVFFPSWVWTIDGGARFAFYSYHEDLAVRDSVKCRRIVESEWYRERWGDRVRIVSDQNTKKRFDLEAGGFRIAASVQGMATGEGADYIAADDPHNARDIWSENKRHGVTEWWKDSMSSRTGRFPTNRKLVVMQRLHEEDLAGHILAEMGDYVHIFLPEEYNPNLRPGRPGQPAKSKPSPIGPVDWRTTPGELLWPARFDARVVQEHRPPNISSYAKGAQYDQVPSPTEGDLFKRINWRFWEPPTEHFGPVAMHLPEGKLLLISPRKLPFRGEYYGQGWDFTFKGRKEARRGGEGELRDFVAGWEFMKAGPDIYVMDRIHEQLDFMGTIRAMNAMRRRWPETGRIYYEDAANGPAIHSVLRRKVPGLIGVSHGNDNLLARAHAYTYLHEAGNILLPHPAMCPWVWEVIEIFAAFPTGATDDDVAALLTLLKRVFPRPVSPEVDPTADRYRRAGRYPTIQSR